jgi:hypothetical protein
MTTIIIIIIIIIDHTFFASKERSEGDLDLRRRKGHFVPVRRLFFQQGTLGCVGHRCESRRGH